MSDEVPTSTTPPSAADVTAADWSPRALGEITGQRTNDYQAVIRRSVVDAIHSHGKSITSVEICGVLVGNVFHDDNGPYLHIHGSIPGDRAASHAAQVTFTAETWTAIQAVMDRDFPDDRIVGWYHTHPGFGVFLSGMDLFIQDNFFNLPWQVALVYDPLSGDEGLFFWKDGKTDRQPYLIEADPPAQTTPVVEAAPSTQTVDTPQRHSLFLPSLSEPGTAPQADPVGSDGRQTPLEPYNPPAIPFDTHASPYAGTQGFGRSNGFRIPMWLIGAVVFIGSFGVTLWAMYTMQGEEVVLPHHPDQPTNKNTPPLYKGNENAR